MVNNVKEVKLLAVRDGTYTCYVFQVIDALEYIMCTRLPNWQVPEIKIGDVGYLDYQIVKAGEKYFDPKTGEMMSYLYSNIYFINFIPKTEILKNNEIIL